MYAPRPIRTTRSAMVERRPRTSAPPPPAIDPASEYETWHHEKCHPRDVALLGCGQRDASIVGFLRANRNQVFLLREPPNRVHEQVSVPLDSKDAVRGEVGIAEHHDARFRL